MDWLSVLSLILIGIILIVVEVIFIPGTTVVGILGSLFTIAGIAVGYSTFGSPTGSYILIASLFAIGLVFFTAFKTGAWSSFALKEAIVGKVNEDYKPNLQIEQRGVALSSLRPIGKAEFDDKTYEVRTIGNYVDAGHSLKIIKLEGNNIFVEPINE
ncbi:MAG: NfeD family protein [Cyclobacteriaceae bacterium]